jgi:branched-chain amino acid transport system ATP-binding protein
MLTVDGLTLGYGGQPVLTDVAFSLAEGEALALLGRNGAGKSTLMKALIGLIPLATGRILWRGDDISRWPPFRRARAGIGYVPEERRIFADLTVAENLATGLRTPDPESPLPPWDIARILSLFPALTTLLNQRGGAISGGEAQMLAIARCLLGQPRLLLLDEPAEGLAPMIVQDMIEAIKLMSAAGLTLLLSEQMLPVARACAPRALVLGGGKVQAAGMTGGLLADTALTETWLGV